MDSIEDFAGENIGPDFINAIEDHIHHIQDGRVDSVRNVINNIKLFIKKFQSKFPNDTENCDKAKDSHCNSLLSMMDIKMEIVEDNLTCEVRGFNSKDDSCSVAEINRVANVNIEQAVTSKDAGNNTDIIHNCDVSVQTKKIKNDMIYDFVQDLYFLKGRTNDVHETIGTFRSKFKKVYETMNIAQEKLHALLEIYNPCLDSKLLSLQDVETNTCDSWSHEHDSLLDASRRLPMALEKLSLMTKENDQFEEKSCHQMKELEIQFDIMEQLSVKNEELSRSFDTLSIELLEEKEMNEFQESENRVLKSSFEKLQDEFREYIKCQEKKMREIMASLRSDRNHMLAENRLLNYKFETEERNFIMNRGDERFYAKDVIKTRESVRNYPLYGSDNEKEIVILRKTLTLLEEESLCLSQDKERWETEREHISTMMKDDDYYLKKNIEELTALYAQFEEDFRVSSVERDKNRACYDELKVVCKSFNERCGDNLVDACREVLSRYNN